MLNSIRNFSKTIFAKILLVIVVIPFVFWGMGGVFSSGNTNSLAKIDNINISTQEFIEHINDLNINQEAIRENLDNEIVEELLSELISKKILEIQINELDINITEKNLANIIKKNPNFFDENNNFSRLKYEKFLLTNQIDAPTFERRLKERELQNNLFNFISGGIYSPLFLTKKLYENETKKIEIEYIDLKEIYGSKDSIKNNDVNKYIDKNENNLKQEFINYSYVKLTPTDLIGSEEYNQIFFDKIDEIENKILTGNSLSQIVLEYKLEKKSKENVNVSSELTNIDNKILDLSSKSQIDIIDMNEFYLLYEIENIVKKLPDRNNDSFIKSVKDKIYQEKRINHNIELLQKINAKKFTDADFNKIVNSDKSKIKKLLLNSSRDNKTFQIDSIKIIYNMPIKSFTMASDEDKNIYLVKILREIIDNSSFSGDKINDYQKLSASNINKEILTAYDFYLNEKYKIKINEQTLERVKNYFR